MEDGTAVERREPRGAADWEEEEAEEEEEEEGEWALGNHGGENEDEVVIT